MLKKLVSPQPNQEELESSKTEQIQQATVGEPSSDDLGRLRDILFGSQSRTLETRLGQLDAELQSLRQELTKKLNAEISKIAESTSAGIGDTHRTLNEKLENQSIEQADQLRATQKKLTDQLDTQANEQATQFRALQKELADGLEKLTFDFQRQLREIQKELGDKLEKLGAEQIERVHEVQAESRQRDDDLRQELLVLVNSLGTKKASRQDLGQMLVELGARLQNGTDSAP